MIDMIQPNLFLVPLVFGLVALTLLALYYAGRQGARQPRQARSRIYLCTHCRHVYVDSRDVPLARCDRCGTMNEAVKR